jgi:CheY-like chemotaxis protein
MSGLEAMTKYQDWVNSDQYTSINKDMLLVGFSAYATDEDLEKAFQFGMHFFCAKPPDTKMLGDILAKKRAARTLAEVIQAVNGKAEEAKEVVLKDTVPIEALEAIALQQPTEPLMSNESCKVRNRDKQLEKDLAKANSSLTDVTKQAKSDSMHKDSTGSGMESHASRQNSVVEAMGWSLIKVLTSPFRRASNIR